MSLTAIQTASILVDTLWRIIQLALFSLIRFVYVRVQWIFWRLNGTSQLIEESLLSENYERSVQVFDILVHYSFEWVRPVDTRNFILAHNRFESPSYILDNEHITLLTLTESHAIFAEARDRSAHLWKTEHGAFLKVAQVRHSNRLLFVPLSAFHQLAATVRDPKGSLIFFHCTGRCGSTLVVQMLNTTDRILAISEPDACNVVRFWALEGKKLAVPIDELQRDVVRLLCRPYKTFRPLVYVVKFPSYHAQHMSVYQDLFPTSKQVFMYRNTSPTLRSQYGMIMGLVSTRAYVALSPILPNKVKEYFLRSFGALDERFIQEGDWKDIRMFLLGLLVEPIFYYLESRRNGLDIQAIRYEDIIADPMYACKRILEFCGAPESLLERAIEGMKTDAQRSSSIAKAAVASYKCPEFNQEFRHAANRLLRKHELPELDEELLLEGTITQKKSR